MLLPSIVACQEVLNFGLYDNKCQQKEIVWMDSKSILMAAYACIHLGIDMGVYNFKIFNPKTKKKKKTVLLCISNGIFVGSFESTFIFWILSDFFF
jgi:hypothetical protein